MRGLIDGTRHRHCEPERRRGEVHHRRQCVRCSRPFRDTRLAGGQRPAGACHQRRWDFPRVGGQSINTKSYHSLTARRASRSLCSRDGTPTSSTSAPARWILDGARSSPFTGDGISAEAMATPLMRTSYSEMPPDAREIPTPLVACACGSLSTSKTCVPERARAADTLTAVVDFPTPPFWFAMAMTRPIDQTPLSVVPAISLRTFRLTER